MLIGDLRADILRCFDPRSCSKADILVLARTPVLRCVEQIAVGFIIVEKALDREEIADHRRVHDQATAPGAEIGIAKRRFDAKFARGLRTTDVDYSADRVAPEQCALRPFQHLNPFDIKEAGIQAMLAAEINAININADRLLKRLVGTNADAAHGDNGVYRIF